MLYRRTEELEMPGTDVLDFFSETAPCGVIGSFLKDKTNDIADNFAFKHHYITGAMDSEVLCTILEAIHEKRNVTVEMLHRRKNRVTESNVVPLRIMISVQSGRQYIMANKYSDGDPYENEEYIRNFRLILDGIRHQYPIQISIRNRHGERVTTRTIPEYLEYSEKDDKFRLIGTGSKLGNTINVGRITSCEKCGNQQEKIGKRNLPQPRKVIFELVDDRNALEHVLLHFAHFEKQVGKIDDRKYQVTLHYDKEDETEILIRVLLFGPMIRVVKPMAFINLIILMLQ